MVTIRNMRLPDEILEKELRTGELSHLRRYAICDHAACRNQMLSIETLPPTRDMYLLYNFCNYCKTLWSKEYSKCLGCGNAIRKRSRHRPHNMQGKTEEQIGIKRI